MDFHVGGRLRRSWGEKFTAVELYFYYNNSGVESDDEEGAAAGAGQEETDFEEDPVEVRNRYLRTIRATDPVQRKARHEWRALQQQQHGSSNSGRMLPMMTHVALRCV